MRWARAIAPFLLLSCLGGGVRSQTLLVVDTNLPVVRGSGPAVAIVDTLRVDVLDPAGTNVRESREYFVGDTSAWPFSFGVVGGARVRLRLFAARWAEGTVAADGSRVRAPRREVTVDRVVDVNDEDDGKIALRIVLDGDCLGQPVSTTDGTTCVDGASLRGSSRAAEIDDGSPSRIGTWAALAEVPCRSGASPERPCIAGGFDVLGDPTLVGLTSVLEDPVPLRPVVVSPFRMDRLEFTVGRYRALVAERGAFVSAPVPRSAADPYCTFVGPNDTSADAMPLNCVAGALARDVCAAVGGRLPTEAEWEHAASGRGEGRPYPWGAHDPTCCTASLSRSPDPKIGARCSDRGIEPAGSHDGARCPGGGDVSRDGVADLAGSLREVSADSLVASGACAPPGLLRNPRCETGGLPLVKSADFSAGFVRGRVALRTKGTELGAPTEGFRCVYSEPP